MTVDHAELTWFDLPVTSQVTEKGQIWVRCDRTDKGYLVVFELFRCDHSILRQTSATLIWSKFDLIWPPSLWRHRSPKNVNLVCVWIRLRRSIEWCLNSFDRIVRTGDIATGKIYDITESTAPPRRPAHGGRLLATKIVITFVSRMLTCQFFRQHVENTFTMTWYAWLSGTACAHFCWPHETLSSVTKRKT